MTGVRYVSWADTTGYAVAARSYILALAQAGVPITWTPMRSAPSGYVVDDGRGDGSDPLDRFRHLAVEHDTVVVQTVPEYYPPYIEKARTQGKRIFGYTVWELERLPAAWPAVLNRLDGVLVPCRWNAEVFRKSGVTVPVHVVPHLSQYDDGVHPTERDRARWRGVVDGGGAGPRPFVFYTIGFWTNRKATALVLEAYWRAFRSGDPVQMIVKTSRNDVTRTHRPWRRGFRRYHPSPVETAARLARRHADPARFRVVADETLSNGEMLALHEAGDCFVTLARAEGWNLGAFDAARLAKPVVSTAYGGQLDYLDPTLAYLVPYRMVPVHEPIWSSGYKAGDEWAEPDVERAAQALREIYDDRDAAAARAQRLAGQIRARFSKGAVTAAFLAALGGGA